MKKAVTTKYITKNIHQAVRQDRLENWTLGRYLEPLSRSYHLLNSPIRPYGVTIDQELDDIQIHGSLQYLYYYIDDGLIPPTTTEFVRAFLENYKETQEAANKWWNTPYPPSKSEYRYKIRDIWTYSRMNCLNESNSTLPIFCRCLWDRQAGKDKLGTISFVQETFHIFENDWWI